ncbi:hypothetical protein N9R79_05735 [Vibrio sp.]|nr:hypothetical protein [Vibrio sp.]
MELKCWREAVYIYKELFKDIDNYKLELVFNFRTLDQAEDTLKKELINENLESKANIIKSEFKKTQQLNKSSFDWLNDELPCAFIYSIYIEYKNNPSLFDKQCRTALSPSRHLIGMGPNYESQNITIDELITKNYRLNLYSDVNDSPINHKGRLEVLINSFFKSEIHIEEQKKLMKFFIDIWNTAYNEIKTIIKWINKNNRDDIIPWMINWIIKDNLLTTDRNTILLIFPENTNNHQNYLNVISSIALFSLKDKIALRLIYSQYLKNSWRSYLYKMKSKRSDVVNLNTMIGGDYHYKLLMIKKENGQTFARIIEKMIDNEYQKIKDRR